MQWPSVDNAPLSTAPLIVNQGRFTIDAEDIEHRGGKYILQEDETMSLTCNASDLIVREIRPNAGFEFDCDKQGCVVFDGTKLVGRGDRYGSLDVGIYVPTLDYPIGVVQFELTAPLALSGELSIQDDELKIHRFRASNAPPAESKHYPYCFDYNLTTNDGETNWHKLPLLIKHPDDFYSTPSLNPLPYQIAKAYDKGAPIRIRLRSTRGEIYLFRAICKRKEIIRFPEPQTPVAIADWIVRPNTLSIDHERYKFNIETMEESWHSYTQLKFDSAVEWLEFQPIEFSASADMNLLNDGEFLNINMKFDLSDCPDLMDIPIQFLHYLDPSIDGKYFKFLDRNESQIDRDSLEIRFSFRRLLPTKSVQFVPRTTRLVSYYGVLNEGQTFYENNPFSNTNWDLSFELSFKKVPSTHATFQKLCRWSESAVVENGHYLKSKFHPRHAQMYRCVYKQMQPTRGMFCPECGSLTAPSGANFTCTNYRCGWTNSTPMLADFEKVNESWYDYREESSLGIHSYSLNKEVLKTGKYVVSFNGMSFHFEVE